MSPVKRETVEQRKALPLATGLLDYFPDALLVVAEVSRVGNEQHHPGEPLHWDKSKSTDEADALMRHLLDRGTLDGDGLRHSGKVAWRALAMLQRELDADTAVEADRIRQTCHYQHDDLSMCGQPYEAHVHRASGDSHDSLTDALLDHHHHVFNPTGR